MKRDTLIALEGKVKSVSTLLLSSLIQYASKQEKYPNSAETLPPQSSVVETISKNFAFNYTCISNCSEGH